ncbi:MAG: hypothetical protein KKG47_09630, partial [Proteobacteria bacterium]|nr:hypothetical protein [Pseudomonadota bacterium]MBU1736533.1 hypothetical protein [Pseudomonadota bacterium]
MKSILHLFAFICGRLQPHILNLNFLSLDNLPIIKGFWRFVRAFVPQEARSQESEARRKALKSVILAPG